MTGKSFYLIGFLVAIAATIAVASEKLEFSEIDHTYKANTSHDLVAGARVPGDRLVFRQNLVKKSKWLQIVNIEQTFDVGIYEKITQVRALDQKANGNGATASILNGGPGASTVKLRLKSLRGHGINFIVEVYAR